MSGALSGLRVLDLTQMVAGPLCTMILGDLGAEVIKIEPPGGDSSRGIGLNRPCGESDYFLSVNRNKRSVVLDLKTEKDLTVFRALASRADVLVENFRPGAMERLGLSYDSLRAINPRLIYCGMPGFNADSPDRDKPALDPIVQAMSGIMQLTGTLGSGPLKTGILTADFVPPLFAAIGVLAALIRRASTNQGQRVDVSMLDATIFSMLPREQFYFSTGRTPERLGNAHYQLCPWNSYETSDGRGLIVVAHTEKYWGALLKAIGRTELADDPRYRTNALRLDRRDEVDALVSEAIKSRTSSDWIHRLTQAEVLFAPVRDFADVFNDASIADSSVAQIEHPTAGAVSVLKTPIRLSEDNPSIRLPPPLLGQHTAEVLAQLGVAE